MKYMLSLFFLVPVLVISETTGFEIVRSEVVSTSQGQVIETEWRQVDASGHVIGLHCYHSTEAATIATLSSSKASLNCQHNFTGH